MTGQCAVDLMRWDRAKRAPIPIGFTEHYKDFTITRMAHAIARPLRVGGLGISDRRRRRRTDAAVRADSEPLTRVRGEDGTTRFPETKKARTMRCFVCRRHHKIPKNTVWMCAQCGMPLCKVDRCRDQSCLKEHKSSPDCILGCGYTARTRRQWRMPDRLKCYRKTRSGAR